LKAHLSIRSWQLHHSGTRGTKRSRVSQDSSISTQGSYRGPARGKSEIVESYMRSIRGVDAHVHSLPPASVTSSEISWLLDWIMTLNTSEVTISNFKRIHGQVLNFTIESILWWRDHLLFQLSAISLAHRCRRSSNVAATDTCRSTIFAFNAHDKICLEENLIMGTCVPAGFVMLV